LTPEISERAFEEAIECGLLRRTTSRRTTSHPFRMESLALDHFCQILPVGGPSIPSTLTSRGLNPKDEELNLGLEGSERRKSAHFG